MALECYNNNALVYNWTVIILILETSMCILSLRNIRTHQSTCIIFCIFHKYFFRINLVHENNKRRGAYSKQHGNQTLQNVLQYNLYKWGLGTANILILPHFPVIISSKRFYRIFSLLTRIVYEYTLCRNCGTMGGYNGFVED